MTPLEEKHGSLEEFAKAVWFAVDMCEITPREAMTAITKYETELKDEAKRLCPEKKQ
jgi:hypothetical protein